MAKKKKPPEPESQQTERYVKYILDCKKEATDASKDRRAKWAELWQLYQNKQDYSLKMSWQSKCVMPKLFTQVERAAAEIKRAVLQSSKLFTIDLVDDSLQSAINELADLLKQPSAIQDPNAYNEARQQLIKLQKQQDRQVNKKDETEKKFKKEITKSNFSSAYSEMVKAAFLLGFGVTKALWDDKKKTCTYENIDVQNLYISPEFETSKSRRPRYVIEYKEYDLAELKKLAKEANSAGEKVFDIEEIDEIKEDWVRDKKKEKSRSQKGIKQFNPVNRKIGILEFWGDIINPEDDSIEENQLLMIANEKYLIRKQNNPFKHEMPPYVFTIPLPYPHRGWAGISLVESMVKPIYSYNNILNMLVDNLNFIVNKMYEYNPTSLMDAQTITAIFPGKLLKKNTNEAVLKEIITSNVGIVESLKALELLGREMQEGTWVTEFLQGMPGKPKTLGEVEIKTAQSQGMFDVIARDLEENSIKPNLEMTYDLYVQFAEWPERKDNYQITVGGVTLLLMQREQTERLSQILGWALKDQQIAQRTDLDDLYRKILGIYNLSDVYKDVGATGAMTGQLTPEQQTQIQAQAEGDAKRDVMQMSPEQIQGMTPQPAMEGT